MDKEQYVEMRDILLNILAELAMLRSSFEEGLRLANEEEIQDSDLN